MSVSTPKTDGEVVREIVLHLLNSGAKGHEDASWLAEVLAEDAELLAFFRAEVSTAIREKAGDPVKARKIFLSMGKTARAIFGPEYASTKKNLDAESRAAANENGKPGKN
ncbi:MAG: hypothetical protein ABSE40_11945 [Candidatus Sulfotelmatobacter sp.]|jgi:hypothetical protein